jgi:uncharacterized lipoprotein YajG
VDIVEATRAIVPSVSIMMLSACAKPISVRTLCPPILLPLLW